MSSRVDINYYKSTQYGDDSEQHFVSVSLKYRSKAMETDAKCERASGNKSVQSHS